MRLLLFHRRTAGTQDGPSVPELVLCEAAPAPRAQPGAVGSARAPPGGRGLRAGTESGAEPARGAEIEADRAAGGAWAPRRPARGNAAPGSKLTVPRRGPQAKGQPGFTAEHFH